MYRLPVLLFLSIGVLFISCGDQSPVQVDYPNLASDGFNQAGSDEAAIAIADEVMEAMGGRKAWDTSRYIKWTFFGRRTHTWDKIGQRNRIDIPGDNLSVIIDLKNKTGTAFKDGMEITQQDTLAQYIENGYKMWINDSYWLVMPYKLKDSGVTLKSAGKDTTTLGLSADILQLTFEGVGVTPSNKYLVYVDEESRLVTQWDFYATQEDSVARFQSPWPNYKKYGDLLLSGGQIAGNKLSDISVFQELESDVFSK